VETELFFSGIHFRIRTLIPRVGIRHARFRCAKESLTIVALLSRDIPGNARESRACGIIEGVLSGRRIVQRVGARRRSLCPGSEDQPEEKKNGSRFHAFQYNRTESGIQISIFLVAILFSGNPLLMFSNACDLF